MPKPLIERFRPESILEFRAAAIERYRDGVAARLAGRRAAAIYLYGYTAEMTLKAAYFSAIGHPKPNPILFHALKGAKGAATPLGFKWMGDLHNLESWARLLVLTRARHPQLAYSEPLFASEVEDKTRRISASWSVVLQYHKNRPYPYEVARVESAAKWPLDRSYKL